MEKTLLYLKKIKKQKLSFFDILIFGLLFEIAWIIPGIDIFSLIIPLGDSINFCLSFPFWGLLTVRTYNPQLMFILAFSVVILLSLILSVVYIFFHCKIYNVVVKKFLNIEEKSEIKALYGEKTESVKKYYFWELMCFFIKCLISIPFFVWSQFYAQFSDRIEHVIIAIIVVVLFIIVDVYVILTRVFIVPTFISDKYKELNSQGLFSLSNKIFSIKLFLPCLFLAFIYLFANVLAFIGTTIIFVIIEKFALLGFFKLLLWLLFAVVSGILTYYIAIFCFVYSLSCQELIFPENPLILANRSDEGKIEEVYTIFEKDKIDEE